MRVMVVGAGFAGLAAADALQRMSADVVVLEARERVGGRVWSQALAGAVIERGAEFILPDHTVLLELANRFGLHAAEKGVDFGNREPRGGLLVSQADYRAGIAALDGALRQSRAQFGLSIRDFLLRITMTEGAREAITARLEITHGCSVEQLDSVGLGADASDFGSYPSYTLAGGNQGLADALAAGIDNLHLRTAVDTIERTAAGYTVKAGAQCWQGDAVVVSVPASVLKKIRFTPALPDWQGNLVARIPYGHAAKLFVALHEPAPPSAVVSVPERFWTSTGKAADGGALPYCVSFAGTLSALDALAVRQGAATWVAAVKRLRPDLALNENRVLLSTWHDDPWVEAVYSAEPVGSLHSELPALAEPRDKLVFCGEHLAGRYAGYMEGALRSGYDAARMLGDES